MTGDPYAEAIPFFTALEKDNSRSFGKRERSRYDEQIRPSFLAALDEVSDFGRWRVFRPHNDARLKG